MVKIRVVILTAFLFGTLALPPAHSQGPPTLPSWAKEYFDKGLAAAQRQAWDEAFSKFKRALGPTPEYAPVYFNLGVVFEKVGAPLEAAACLQAYLALAPNAANAAAVRQEIVGLKKTRAAQINTILQRAADTIPTLPDYDRNKAYLAIALNYARAGEIGKAIDLVKSMRRDNDNPTDRVPDLRIPDPWLHYAATIMAGNLIGSDFATLSGFHSSGFPEAAQKLLVLLEKTFPIPAPIGNRNDDIATKIDKIFKERSETLASIRNGIAKALAVPSGTPDQKPEISVDPKGRGFRHDLLGWLKVEKRDYVGAIAALTGQIGLDPEMARSDRGRAKQEMGDLDKAIELNPQDADAYYKRAEAKRTVHDADGAIADYTKAIELGLPFYNERALAKELKGDLGGAVADYSKYIELDPNYWWAYYQRGCLRYALGSWTDALADFRKVIALKGDLSDFSMLRIWLIRSRLGERAQATSELKQYSQQRDAGKAEDEFSRIAALLTDQTTLKHLFRVSDGSKQIAFADSLIGRSWNFSNDSINKSSFDLDFQIKSRVDPKNSSFEWASHVGGPEYATVLGLGKVAAEFGAELFLFELLERGSEGARDAVEGPAVEKAVWKSVQDGRNPERLSGYLAWFPRGKYAELADLSMKKLMAESKLASPAPKPETVSVDEALRLGREALKVSNHPEAMRWFRAAADRGNADAQTQVGWMYSMGDGVARDSAEALRWYRKAADQGHANAELYVGDIYDVGAQGIPKDPEEALRWYRKAADKGVSLAQINIGYYYKKAQNYPEAMKWYLKASDHPYAQMAIGEFYEKGLGVKKDLAQAAHWYRLVANTKGFFMENAGLEALKRIGAVK